MTEVYLGVANTRLISYTNRPIWSLRLKHTRDLVMLSIVWTMTLLKRPRGRHPPQHPENVA